MTRHSWKPSRQDYLDALISQNPWQHLGQVPESLAFRTARPLARELWRTMVQEPRRYQVVLGPRRVGKTVTLYQTIQRLIREGIEPRRLWFMRLDHPLFMDFGLDQWVKAIMRRESPKEEEPIFLFLDEVNYAPLWDKWLKTFHDERWPVRVVATSSSTAALVGPNKESGIGRWSEQHLAPYDFLEYLELRGIGSPDPGPSGSLQEAIARSTPLKYDTLALQKHLEDFLLIGGFPELLTALKSDEIQNEMIRSQQVLRSEAVQRVTGMDIPQVFDVRDPLTLERLLCVLAGQMCGLMNITRLATMMEKNRETVLLYIRHLETAYLIFTLSNYARTEEVIQRRGRKVYFVDGAVRNAALQRGVRPLNDPVEKGSLYENVAASHLRMLALQRGSRLFHWRDGDHEVDLVYDDTDGPLAFEVAAGTTHGRSGLVALQKKFKEFRGRCYIVSASTLSAELPDAEMDGIGRIPLTTFLCAVSRQSASAMALRLGLTRVT